MREEYGREEKDSPEGWESCRWFTQPQQFRKALGFPAAGICRHGENSEGRETRKGTLFGLSLEHSVIWPGRDFRGNPAASGVYLIALRAGTKNCVRKMLLIR